MNKLTIELVPRTCWYSNVRSEVSSQEWDKIKLAVSSKAGRMCEICGGRGPKWPVECHEVWDYNDKTKTQTLARMIALCPSCHEVKHIGLASIKGREEIAATHLAKVNQMSLRDAKQYIRESFEKWYERSEHQWKLDLSALSEYGITPSKTRKGIT